MLIKINSDKKKCLGSTNCRHPAEVASAAAEVAKRGQKLLTGGFIPR